MIRTTLFAGTRSHRKLISQLKEQITRYEAGRSGMLKPKG
jgi:hypothetical protein